MTRADAVQLLAGKGFTVKERSWSFQESICVFGSPQTSDEIEIYHQMATLYPTGDEKWVVAGSWAPNKETDFRSLTDAVAYILESMSPPTADDHERGGAAFSGNVQPSIKPLLP
ncbi:hypothetical protein [Neorhizobium sp. P12A]|uniref:hypothetical protein n=1 Tax=Neorhizobium sp. P12A TaxID=2268027 RepID=UPI0011EFAD1E|nr:hypothetical protein [Neorhizobium sp. P12A]